MKKIKYDLVEGECDPVELATMLNGIMSDPRCKGYDGVTVNIDKEDSLEGDSYETKKIEQYNPPNGAKTLAQVIDDDLQEEHDSKIREFT